MAKSLVRVLFVAGVVAAIAACAGRKMTQFEIDYLVSETDRMIILDDLDSASHIINTVAKGAPQDTFVLLRQGVINRQLGTVEGRIKSENALRKLVDLEPENADYRLELAKTLVAQTFEMEARGHLSRVIEMTPDKDEPYLILAGLYRRPYFLDDDLDRADSAQEVLKALLDRDANSLDGQIMYGELCAVRGQTNSADDAADKALSRDSKSKSANLLKGYCQYLLEDYENAGKYFSAGIAAMDSAERAGYESILYLIPPQNTSLFQKLPASRRDSVRTQLWAELDFDPTTSVNERLVEHYARVWMANLLYSDKRNQVEGWTTDMGETLIRMGFPDDRERAKIHSGHTSGVPAWYWYYTSTQYPCTLAFVDHMLSGQYRFPFTYSDNTGSSRANSSKEIAYLNYREIPQESMIARQLTPVEIELGAYSFAYDDTSAELALVSEIPFASKIDHVPLEYRFVVRDSEGREVYSNRDGKLTTPEGQLDSNQSVIRAARLRLQPGMYQISTAVENREKKLLGVVTATALVREYHSDSIVMSDVVLGTKKPISMRESVFQRSDSAQIVPRPKQEFSVRQPLRLYYEIYNLPTDLRSLTRFDVSYTFQFIKGSERGIKGLLGKIFPGRKESVSYTYREGGKSKVVERDLELDVSVLRPGKYVLTIAVDDLVLGEKTSQTTELTLLE